MNGERLSAQLNIFGAFVGERKGAKNISSHTVIYLGTANWTALRRPISLESR